MVDLKSLALSMVILVITVSIGMLGLFNNRS